MRSKDFLNRYNIQKTLSTQLENIGGESGLGFERRGETRWQVCVEGAGASNAVQPYGKLKGQAAWVAIGSALTGAIAGASTAVDVKNFDFVKFVPTILHSLGQTIQVQTLTPDAAPDAGVFKIRFVRNGVTYTTGALAFNISAANIQVALRALGDEFANVTVSGTLATAVVITMSGLITDQAVAVIVDSTLTATAVPVVVTPAITTPFVAGAEIKLIASSFYD